MMKKLIKIMLSILSMLIFVPYTYAAWHNVYVDDTGTNFKSSWAAGTNAPPATNTIYFSSFVTSTNIAGYGITTNGQTVVNASNAAYSTVTSNLTDALTNYFRDASHVTNLESTVILTNGGNASLSITIPLPTSTNQPARYDQLLAIQNGNVDIMMTTNKTLAYTNTITPTNFTYLANNTSTYGPSIILTNTTCSAGAYAFAFGDVSNSYQSIKNQTIPVDLYCAENAAGSMYIVIEPYYRDIVTGGIVDPGVASVSNIVAAGTIPLVNSFSLKLPDYTSSSNKFQIWFKVKDVAGASTTLLLGVGSNYQTHATISVASDVLLLPYAKLDGSSLYTGPINLNTNNITNAASIYATGLTVATNGASTTAVKPAMAGTPADTLKVVGTPVVPV